MSISDLNPSLCALSSLFARLLQSADQSVTTAQLSQLCLHVSVGTTPLESVVWLLRNGAVTSEDVATVLADPYSVLDVHTVTRRELPGRIRKNFELKTVGALPNGQLFSAIQGWSGLWLDGECHDVNCAGVYLLTGHGVTAGLPVKVGDEVRIYESVDYKITDFVELSQEHRLYYHAPSGKIASFLTNAKWYWDGDSHPESAVISFSGDVLFVVTQERTYWYSSKGGSFTQLKTSSAVLAEGRITPVDVDMYNGVLGLVFHCKYWLADKYGAVVFEQGEEKNLRPIGFPFKTPRIFVNQESVAVYSDRVYYLPTDLKPYVGDYIVDYTRFGNVMAVIMSNSGSPVLVAFDRRRCISDEIEVGVDSHFIGQYLVQYAREHGKITRLLVKRLRQEGKSDLELRWAIPSIKLEDGRKSSQFRTTEHGFRLVLHDGACAWLLEYRQDQNWTYEIGQLNVTFDLDQVVLVGRRLVAVTRDGTEFRPASNGGKYRVIDSQGCLTESEGADGVFNLEVNGNQLQWLERHYRSMFKCICRATEG